MDTIAKWFEIAVSHSLSEREAKDWEASVEYLPEMKSLRFKLTTFHGGYRLCLDKIRSLIELQIDRFPNHHVCKLANDMMDDIREAKKCHSTHLTHFKPMIHSESQTPSSASPQPNAA